MVRSSAIAVTLPRMVSPLRRVHSLSRRASRAATMASSYLLVPGGGINEASLVISCSPSRDLGSRGSGRAAESSDPRPLGVHDRGESRHGGLELVVPNQIVVVAKLPQLARGVAETLVDHLRRVRAALGQPLPQRLDRGWADEHRHRVRLRAPHRRSTLNVHLQHHHLVLPELILHERARRAVEMPVHLGPFEELPGRAPALEFLAGGEMVMHAVGLVGTLGPRRGGDREHALGARGQQSLDQRALADAGRSRDHQQEAAGLAIGGHRHRFDPSCRFRRAHAHSTFCTCSRRRSSSSLITITALAISTSFALDPIVLASRFISWSRKLSFRPASSEPSISERYWSMWAESRTHSSVQSRRSASSATSCAIRSGSISTSASKGFSRLSMRSLASAGRSGARSAIRSSSARIRSRRFSKSRARASPSRPFIVLMLSQARFTSSWRSAQVSSSERALCSQLKTSGKAARVRRSSPESR